LSIAFVLGNGTSREGIPLEPLKKFGTVYACNAVYRDFDPDYLVAVDTKMVNEIVHRNYQHKRPVWTNYNKTFEKYKGLNYFTPSKGWSSGPTALDLASSHNHSTIYILGFDFRGIGPEHKRVNNLYSGTQNYKGSHDTATYYGNWLRQTTLIMQQNDKKRYIRVILEKGFIPEPLDKFSNVTHVNKEDFCKSFNIL
jgi:hypothetical protein